MRSSVFYQRKALTANLLSIYLFFFVDQSSVYKNIILICALFLNRILLLCLTKRWNMQYRLYPKRQPIAILFEAKGVPFKQAEFDYSDIAILFICWAVYYSGLNFAQFSKNLQHILRSDDPAAEYDRWTYTSNIILKTLHS